MIVPQHLQRLRVNLCKVPLQHFCVKRHYNQYIFNNNNKVHQKLDFSPTRVLQLRKLVITGATATMIVNFYE